MRADELADQLTLADALEFIKVNYTSYKFIDHWQQGEFHHDTVFKVDEEYVVIATNCNGGIKEVLIFDRLPNHLGLWSYRCPDNPEFTGDIPDIISMARTDHYFDPCELLREDARSELKDEFKVRQLGGGWVCSVKDHHD